MNDDAPTIALHPVTIRLILAGAALLGAVPSAQASDLPKFLIIGDSITAYHNKVRGELAGQVVVVRHYTNTTEHLLANLTDILNQIDGPLGWDVIQFNAGLHDIAYRDYDADAGETKDMDPLAATSQADYAANLNTMVSRLQNETNAKLIWASTTIVPPDEYVRYEGDEVIYNAIAAPIMQANGIVINDLWALTSTFEAEHFIAPHNVHHSDAGQQLLGAQVADIFRSVAPELIPSDTGDDGYVDNGDLAVAISNFTGPQTDPATFFKDVSTGDTDTDGDVDNGDLAKVISAFTGPGPAPVPEPASLALLGLGGLTLACRRRS